MPILKDTNKPYRSDLYLGMSSCRNIQTFEPFCKAVSSLTEQMDIVGDPPRLAGNNIGKINARKVQETHQVRGEAGRVTALALSAIDDNCTWTKNLRDLYGHFFNNGRNNLYCTLKRLYTRL